MAALDFYPAAETSNAQSPRPMPGTPPVNLAWRDIRTTAQLEEGVAQLQDCKVLGIDTETTGLDPHSDRVRLVQVASAHQPTLVIDLWQVGDWSALAALLQGSALKVGHTLKFDWQMLRAAGLPLQGPYFDTQLAYQVLKAGIRCPSNLRRVVKRVLKVLLDKSQQRSDFSRWELTVEQRQYAAWDAAYALGLRRRLVALLKQYSAQWGQARLLAIAKLESACIPATAWMEFNGMGLDPERWQEAIAKLQGQRQQAFVDFHQALGVSLQQQISLLPELSQATQYGINLGSSQQVKQALASQGLDLKSTDQRSVIKVVDRHPALPPLLEWRRVAKVLDTMIGLPAHRHQQTQRLHPQVFQMGARSGRFSCRHPALQTMPHQALVRRCFTAAPGHVLLKADYSQIELRIIAKVTRDPLLVQAYRRGRDVHRMTAGLLMDKPPNAVSDEERRLAKAINFGLIYGMSAIRLQLEAQLKYGVILSHRQALHFHRRYFELFEGVREWHRRGRRLLQGKRRVRQTYTLLGRVRRWQEQPSLNEWLNFPVQGTNVDIIKRALVKLVPVLSPEVKLLMVVHDEIVLEVRAELAETVAHQLVALMEQAAAPVLSPIPVKVAVQVGQSWAGE